MTEEIKANLETGETKHSHSKSLLYWFMLLLVLGLVLFWFFMEDSTTLDEQGPTRPTTIEELGQSLIAPENEVFYKIIGEEYPLREKEVILAIAFADAEQRVIESFEYVTDQTEEQVFETWNSHANEKNWQAESVDGQVSAIIYRDQANERSILVNYSEDTERDLRVVEVEFGGKEEPFEHVQAE